MGKRNLNKFLEEWFDGGVMAEEAVQRKLLSGMPIAGPIAKEGAELPIEA